MTTHAAAITTSVLHTREEAAAFELQLRSLWQRSSGTAFQHPGWWIPWSRRFGTASLHVIVIADEGTWRAALPLYASEESNARVYRVLGCSVGDYLDAIVDRDASDEVERALADALDGIDGSVDLPDLAADAALRPVLARCRRPVEWFDGARCPVATLPSSVTEWRAGLPHGLTRNLRRYGARFASLRGAGFETATLATLDEVAGRFLALHAARWQARGLPGVVADAAVQAFHRESLSALFDAGLTRLHAMRHAGRIIAAQYVLVRPPHAWSYLSGFDPEWARSSPGTLLIGFSIERAIEEGCRQFDFLRGEESYKTLWSDDVRETGRAWLPATGGAS